MTDRPPKVDLEPFEGITLPDDWATAYTYGNGKVLHANIPAWLADLTATRDELAVAERKLHDSEGRKRTLESLLGLVCTDLDVPEEDVIASPVQATAKARATIAYIKDSQKEILEGLKELRAHYSRKWGGLFHAHTSKVKPPG